MNILFFIILTLFLFVLQTVLLPSFAWFEQSFDLMIIAVLYICLIARRHTVLIPIILTGAVMDSASGLPFFFYIFSYVWIYFIIQLANQLLFQHSAFFIMVMSVVAVMIQQGLLLFLLFIQQGGQDIPTANLSIMVRQIFWGVLFIPSSIWVLSQIRQAGFRMVAQVKKQMAHRYKGEL